MWLTVNAAQAGAMKAAQCSIPSQAVINHSFKAMSTHHRSFFLSPPPSKPASFVQRQHDYKSTEAPCTLYPRSSQFTSTSPGRIHGTPLDQYGPSRIQYRERYLHVPESSPIILLTRHSSAEQSLDPDQSVSSKARETLDQYVSHPPSLAPYRLV